MPEGGTGYTVVVPKGYVEVDDFVVYLPNDALLSEFIIERLGLVGKLAGPGKNRVMPIRLRGELSEGLVINLDVHDDYVQMVWPVPEPATLTGVAITTFEEGNWSFGSDVSELLGITKYEPPVPSSFSGGSTKLQGDHPHVKSYDIEPFEKMNDIFLAMGDEWVIVTEKLHGTCGIFGYHVDCGFFVSSKGLASRKIVIDNPGDGSNVYWRAAEKYFLAEKLKEMCELTETPGLIIYAEVIGTQDLMYGLEKGDVEIRVFDMRGIGVPDNPAVPEFCPAYPFEEICNSLRLPMAPILYTGIYDEAILLSLRDGTTEVGVDQAQIREGIVIKTVKELPNHWRKGRFIMKWVSPAYKTRKDGTEYN
jgi:RNA ligase (TIGR02306 family)